MIARNALSRRVFLRAGGVALALPFLDAMMPRAWAAAAAQPKRMICISTALGMHGPLFFPRELDAISKSRRISKP